MYMSVLSTLKSVSHTCSALGNQQRALGPSRTVDSHQVRAEKRAQD